MNVYDLVRDRNRDNGNKYALSITSEQSSDRIITYDEMFGIVDQIAANVLNHKVCSGDRIAIISENVPEWNMTFLALAKLNCTAVLLDSTLIASDLLGQIIRSEVMAVIVSPLVFAKVSKQIPKEIRVLNLFTYGLPFEEDCSRQACLETSDRDERVCAIIFSSGTTRVAAGIMHSHDALVGTTMMVIDLLHLKPTSVFFSVIPNSHIYGLICSILGPLLVGGEMHYIEKPTSSAIASAFTEYKPTIFPCVPKVFELFKSEIMRKIDSQEKTRRLFGLFFPICLAIRQKTGINLGKILFKSIHQGFGGKIDIFCSAGAPMDRQTAEFYIGTGFDMLITYGATETNIPTLGNRGKKLTTDSCGPAYPAVSVKISESGELLIKSPYMMMGYFREPELTKAAFADGWFMTGDLCRQNAKGNYEIIGRCKENIVLASGKKVIPDDIERAYSCIPGIKEMVACGVPDTLKSYDEIHLFIVKEVESDASQILQSIQNKRVELPPHMKVAKIHFLQEIPRTSLQKPKRFLLKKIALDEAASQDERVSPSVQEERSTKQGVIRIISEIGHMEQCQVRMDAKIFSELGIDSLGSIDLGVQIECLYGRRVDYAFTQELTVEALIDLIDRKESEMKFAKERMVYPRRKKHADYVIFRYFCLLARAVYKIRVSNENVIPEDNGYIVCANHVTNFDYLWLGINFSRRRFEKFCCMAKQEILGESPVRRIVSQVCGMIPVDRTNFHAETMNCCQKQLKEKWGLLIHPEGTRSNNGELGVFKKGAAVLAIETNVPIIPAYIHGAYDVYPKGSKLPRLFNFRSMRKYPVDVIYGNPIFPHGMSAEELIVQVKEAILVLKKTHPVDSSSLPKTHR